MKCLGTTATNHDPMQICAYQFGFPENAWMRGTGTKVYALERIVENILAAGHSRLVGDNKLTKNLIISNP